MQDEDDHPPLVPLAKRNKKSCPNTWKQNVNKSRRARGESYHGLKKSTDETSKKKWLAVEKPAKIRGSLCKKATCGQRSKHCAKFSEEDCDKIFAEYWGC